MSGEHVLSAVFTRGSDSYGGPLRGLQKFREAAKESQEHTATDGPGEELPQRRLRLGYQQD